MISRRTRVVLIVAALSFKLGAATADEDNSNRYWPQWRGPKGTGTAPEGNPPTDWSETESIRWKVPLPGKGLSTPIIWQDRIFVTTAIPYGRELEPRYSGAPGAHDNVPVTRRHEFVVISLSRQDGSTIWRKTVHEGLPHEGGHYTGSLASGSPVTDGKLVYAYFGSHGLYCFDWDGDLQWKIDLGQMNTKHGHGEGSSPALFQDTLVVNWDHEGQSYVVALDKQTGRQRWRVERNEVTSWASPIVVEQEGKPQVIISGTDRLRGYDLGTGDVIWECGGLSSNVVATPVAGDGMVIAGSSYETRNLLAIQLDGAQGDITGSDRVVWSRTQGTPYVPSPLLYKGYVYFLRHYQGILSRVDAKTGEERVGPFRLNGLRNIYASPVAAGNRLYVTDLDGSTMVISHGPIPRIMALNRLDDRFGASAAIAGDEIYLRGEKFLYCIASDLD